MTILTPDIEKSINKISAQPVKRNIAPSASNVLEDMFSFILDTPGDALPETQIDNLYQLLGDLAALDKVELNESRFSGPVSDNEITEPVNEDSWEKINEALHFLHKSTSIARTIARKFYKANKPKIKAMQSKLKKSKAAKKKKEILAKSDRTPIKKRKKRKYNTKNHTINESKLRAGIKASVEELFAPIKYRVIESFNVAGVDAALYEEIHFKFGIWTLRKRDGEKILFKCEKEDIENYIKLESEGITLEDIDV